MKAPLRIPWIISALIALVVFGVGWKQSSHLKQLREKHQTLLTKTQSLNLKLDEPASLSTRSQTNTPKANLQEIARAFINCGVEFKDCRNDHDVRKLDLASRDRIAAAINGVDSLNQAELKELIQIIADEPELNYLVRQNLLTFPLAKWGKMNRPALLEYLATSPELKQQLRSNYLLLVRMNIYPWITEAPDEMVAWMRSSRDKLPDDILNTATSTFARTMAMTEPLKTFDFIQEFSDKPHFYFPSILQKSTMTPPERAKAIERIHAMAGDLGSENKRHEFLEKNLKAFVLSQKTHEADFQTSIDTIKTANLKVEDIEFIWNVAVADLGYYIKEEQAGDWVNWLHQNIPAEKSAYRIKQLLKTWSKYEPQKAAAFAKKNGFRE